MKFLQSTKHLYSCTNVVHKATLIYIFNKSGKVTKFQNRDACVSKQKKVIPTSL
jgi:hypothetical protein